MKIVSSYEDCFGSIFLAELTGLPPAHGDVATK